MLYIPIFGRQEPTEEQRWTPLGPRHLLGTVGLDSQFEMICFMYDFHLKELLALCLKGMSWIHGCILFMVYSQMACISGASTDLALTCRPEFFSRALQPSPSVSLGGAI